MDKHIADLGHADRESVTGEFIDHAGERYYVIRNVDEMDPFFVSVISNDDHWLFVSSTGGMTAGRVSPKTALFPYATVDKIHECSSHTGSKTLLRVLADDQQFDWEPFNQDLAGHGAICRNLYKNLLGNKLCFEEINHELRLAFRYTWSTSDKYGFVRDCELQNLADDEVAVELLDGLQNILPAGTPSFAQANTSNLVDAYKWTELDASTGLACFTLYSGITDRAEPCESLKANTVFSLGLTGQKMLISSEQVNAFRRGAQMQQEVHRRGIRGAYFVNIAFDMAPRATRHWQLVANVEQTQCDVVALGIELSNPATLGDAILSSVVAGSDQLARIMASADGFQATAEENVSVHHYANVLFNVLRGGIFDDQYTISSRDLRNTIRHFNRATYARHSVLLNSLPPTLKFPELLQLVAKQGDAQLQRLCGEYLPLTFGRRHGDPSRPWNQFSIKLKDEHGNGLLSYEGNWRDIFQNWEALAVSFPEFVENMIAKFVNASTTDGYNPYRISKEGIDWEVEEPDNPWSYIGYWGDHQIIYLQKLLELSAQFHPQRLASLLRQPVFSYANVPYRIKPFEALLENPKSTVDFDNAAAAEIERRVERLGADGKLMLDADGDVYLVNLLEKLLVPLLSKLGNLVIDGGIWMNTQRPEWNDANNALVGQGLSMVTLYYMRRYLCFLKNLLASNSGDVELSGEVNQWLADTAASLAQVRPSLGAGRISATQRFATLAELGQASSRYRQAIYMPQPFSGKVKTSLDEVRTMLDDALAATDHSIATNRREDGLYHAYNLLDLGAETIEIDKLYPMLEGQVAALSAGAVVADDAVSVLEALFKSDVYRPDQHSFMLYPDRHLPGFLGKNQISEKQVAAIPLLQQQLASNDERIVARDAAGCFRFNAEFTNVAQLNAALDAMQADYGAELAAARGPLRELYENVFNHQAFTGRSGTMFGFEGLGSIYWHMVAKLLLAVQENFFATKRLGSVPETCTRLGQLYYSIRAGIGFNKTPAEYGAFPTDPYSHTPKHAGARQPGMTGQVKEEILSRFGELGIHVSAGTVQFQPALLRVREFATAPRPFRFLDVDDKWQSLTVPPAGLAFSWCQVPVIYRLDEGGTASLDIVFDDGNAQSFAKLELPAEESAELFQRSGRIRQMTVTVSRKQLFSE